MSMDTKRELSLIRGESARIGILDNPLDFIAEDHMREREVCALIDKMVSVASLQDADIDQMLSFLEDQLPHHLADEEVDLFPLMLKRCDPEDEIERVIDRLLSDHGHALADSSAIIAVIRSVDAASPVLSDEDGQKMTAFANHSRRHLILENAIILPIARVRLTDGDLEVMKRNMLKRRELASDAEDD